MWEFNGFLPWAPSSGTLFNGTHALMSIPADKYPGRGKSSGEGIIFLSTACTNYPPPVKCIYVFPSPSKPSPYLDGVIGHLPSGLSLSVQPCPSSSFPSPLWAEPSHTRLPLDFSQITGSFRPASFCFHCALPVLPSYPRVCPETPSFPSRLGQISPLLGSFF